MNISFFKFPDKSAVVRLMRGFYKEGKMTKFNIVGSIRLRNDKEGYCLLIPRFRSYEWESLYAYFVAEQAHRNIVITYYDESGSTTGPQIELEFVEKNKFL